MTCTGFGEFFGVAALTCADIGEFIKVAASATTAITAVFGAFLAWRKANQVIGLRQADVDLRREELNYLKRVPPVS